MKGVRLESGSFLEVFAPLASEAAPLYWTLSLQGGPFVMANQPEHVVAALKRFAVGPEGTLWRPGVFPEFAPLLVSDEWGYFIALAGPEEEAKRSAEFLGRLAWPADLFIEPALRLVELLLIELGPGEWEVYSPHQRWLALLSNHLQTIDIDSEKGEWVDEAPPSRPSQSDGPVGRSGPSPARR
jgi:hypothetical protein